MWLGDREGKSRGGVGQRRPQHPRYPSGPEAGGDVDHAGTGDAGLTLKPTCLLINRLLTL